MLNSPEIPKNQGLANFSIFFCVPISYFLKIIICILQLGTLGTSWVEIDPVTYLGMGATGGQYVENTSKM